MFRYNGFTITVFQDKIVASQGNLKLVFSSFDELFSVLGTV